MIPTNRNDNVDFTVTNTTYELMLTNIGSGIVPVSIIIQNLGPGVAEFRHTNTNGIGYILTPGKDMAVGYWTQVMKGWYSRLVGSTNTQIRIIRESK